MTRQVSNIAVITQSAEIMKHKLDLNNHKQPITSHTLDELYDMKKGEDHELAEEMDLVKNRDPGKIMHECADIMNLCGAMIVKCREQLFKDDLRHFSIDPEPIDIDRMMERR